MALPKVEVMQVEGRPEGACWTFTVDGQPSLYWCPTEYAARRVVGRLLRTDRLTSREAARRVEVKPRGGAQADVLIDGEVYCTCDRGEANAHADCAAFMKRGKLGRLAEAEAAMKAAGLEGGRVYACPERHRVCAEDGDGNPVALEFGEEVTVAAKG